MTNELIKVLDSWIDYKYRERNYYDGKSPTTKFTPKIDDNDLLFSMREDTKFQSIYNLLQVEFYNLLKNLGLDARHDNRRHLITFKTFRDFVKKSNLK